jgi:hypothetical protein
MTATRVGTELPGWKWRRLARGQDVGLRSEVNLAGVAEFPFASLNDRSRRPILTWPPGPSHLLRPRETQRVVRSWTNRPQGPARR